MRFFGPVVQEMSFIHFLSRALAAPLFIGLAPFVQKWKKAPCGTTLRNYFEFGPVVQEEMLFTGISYLELWHPFCSAERNHLRNFGRGYQEEKFCKIIFKWVSGQDMSFLLSGALATLLICEGE